MPLIKTISLAVFYFISSTVSVSAVSSPLMTISNYKNFFLETCSTITETEFFPNIVKGWNLESKDSNKAHFTHPKMQQEVKIVINNRNKNQKSSKYTFYKNSKPEFFIAARGQCIVNIARLIKRDTNGRIDSISTLSPDLLAEKLIEPLNPEVPSLKPKTGIRVALIDTGINYLIPEITKNIARKSHNVLFVFDFEDGSNMGGWNSSSIAWMWRKSEGFATFNYEGTGDSGLRIPHDLGGVPEMIWINNRVSGDWNPVYHSGVNGGVNPENYTLQLNTTAIPYASASYFANTAPTEHDFTVGTNQAMNWANEHYSVAMWRSISGISKVGYYTGATAGVTVTTGFQPRFLILKNATTTSNWTVLDTTRGWGSSNDQRLYLNTTAAQSASDVGAPTSTGFTITNNWDNQGDTIIYYAHA